MYYVITLSFPSSLPLPSQVDKDKDGLVSLQEFMQYTEGKAFETDEAWKPIVDEPDQVSTIHTSSSLPSPSTHTHTHSPDV